MGRLRASATMKHRISRTQFYSYLFSFAILILTIFLLQPLSTEAARDQVGGANIFDKDPLTITSHLYSLQAYTIHVEEFADIGGAIEPLGHLVLLVSARGRIALIDGDGEVTYLAESVPMNEPDLGVLSIYGGFRVADILLHERSPDDFTLFVSHHYFAGDCIEFRVSSTTLRLDQGGVRISGAWKTEYSANPCIDLDFFRALGGKGGAQIGGRMLMDGGDHLLIVIGDNSWWRDDGPNETQKPSPLYDTEYHLGKLVRIELASGRAEILARGLRNPQGLARDAKGNLWETEHGPRAGDELNLLKPDLHYGWPYVTIGTQYGRRIWPHNEAQGRHDGYEKPTYAWIPSIAISSLIVSNSPQFPLWQNDLLISSLREQSLFRVRLHEESAISIEQIEIGNRIRDITELPDGRIALLTDSHKILLLQRTPIYCHEEYDIESIYFHDAAEVCVDISSVIAEAEHPIFGTLHDAQFGRPVIRSNFDVYMHGDLLIYIRGSCSRDDLSHRFFLHVYPADSDDIIEEESQRGFNVYDFYSSDAHVGSTLDITGCMLVVPLPDYEFQHIYTGQITRKESPSGEVSWEGPVWDSGYSFGDPSPTAAPESEVSPYGQTGAEGPNSGAALFEARCSGCHNLAAEHSVGPHLEDLIGRRAGRVDGFNASTALSSLDIVWTQENLAQFIANSSQFAPGTSMPDADVNAEEAQRIAEFLASDQ